jgi:hypothetical protein
MGDLMRYRSIIAGAALALAATAWPGASRGNAQPVVVEKAASMTIARVGRNIGSSSEGPPSAVPIPGSAAAKAEHWDAGEIEAAKSRCKILLEGRNIVAIAAAPIKAGDCGAPAPVQLLSIGTVPQVALSPPPTVTCEMAVALAGWLEAEVQPAAREILGGHVIRLEVMSAYSCRNAYARLKARLSEHGRANALDIALFVTERGEIASLSDWGDTERDVRTRLAATQAQAGRASEAVKEQAVAAMPPTARRDLKGSIVEMGDVAIRPAANPLTAQAPVPALGLAPPSRLGGPRPSQIADTSARQRFLRRVHAAACRHFGTVLGPEANEAHRNHFHLDMADRPIKRICE